MTNPKNNDARMDLSIVIPLYNEAESLPELTAWIDKVMKENAFSYELLFIDDGSTDGSWDIISKLKTGYPAIRGIRFRRNYGKSAALYEGFAACQGDLVATMDADLQDSPEELPEMMRMVREDGYDLVSGWKQKRKDNALTKNLPSKIYNWTARRVTGIKLHDMNCGIKVYRADVVKNIELYSDMHRYIPYLAKNAGFTKIGEKPVHHQKRKYGVSKFGISRFFNGFLDLMTLWFLSKFGKKPMHFFGTSGILMFLVGFVITVWIIVRKLVCQAQGLRFRAVTDQPLFYLALVALVLGVILFLAGFIGEMVSRSSSNRNDYQISDKL